MSVEQTLEVGASAITVYPYGSPEALTVYNVGITTIYVSRERRTSNGFPLNAGDTLRWEAGVPLFLYSDFGNVGRAYVSGSASDYTSSRAIGRAVLDAGLAQEIADRIKIEGAPPIDNQTTLLYQQWSGADLGSTPISIDATQWQSVLIRFSEHVATQPAAPAYLRELVVGWFNEDGTRALGYDGMTCINAGNLTNTFNDNANSLELATRGPIMRVFIDPNPTATADSELQIIGSYRTVQTKRYIARHPYRNDPVGMDDNSKSSQGLTAFSMGTKPAGLNVQKYFNSRSGNATVTFTGTAAGPGALYLVDAEDNDIVYSSEAWSAAGFRTKTESVILPSRPLAFRSDATAWTNMRFVLTYGD